MHHHSISLLRLCLDLRFGAPPTLVTAYLQAMGRNPILPQPILRSPWPRSDFHPVVCLARIYFTFIPQASTFVSSNPGGSAGRDRSVYVILLQGHNTFVEPYPQTVVFLTRTYVLYGKSRVVLVLLASIPLAGLVISGVSPSRLKPAYCPPLNLK